MYERGAEKKKGQNESQCKMRNNIDRVDMSLETRNKCFRVD